MKKFSVILTMFFLAGCAKSLIPIPVSLLPEINRDVVSDKSYGAYPQNYQKILKDYLQNNLLNHEDAKVDFINKPNRLSISNVGKEYTGYRVCLSINSKNGKSIYTGYKTHLFIIKNEKVGLHLFDSGLLKIPFSLCVDSNDKKSIYLDDIPDEQEVTIDQMDQINLKEKEGHNAQSMSNVYILCSIENSERTFVFNQSDNLLSESVGITETQFKNIKFSKTHILGSNNLEEILINRVSGNIIITSQNNMSIEGNCSLLDKKRF